MTTETQTRTIEIDMEIDAPVEAVWAALTDPAELVKWFPLEARVEPGPKGVIALSWGPEIRGEGRIRIWEPNRRLQTSWFEPTEAFGSPGQPHVFREDREAAARLLVDYLLEGRGGRTVLRLVHSGFSRDARWDDEFQAHRRGWGFELRSLRNYLEHHRGAPRQVAWVRAPIQGGVESAWARLMSPLAMLREGSLEGASVGSRYRITTVHGDRLEGEVLGFGPPIEFAGTVENLDHSLTRCGVETYTGKPEVFFWLSTWGKGRARAESFEKRWQETLEKNFPS